MSSIKKYILEQVARRELSQEDAKSFLTELASTAVAATPARDTEVAIIGMAGRFPMARNADEFWELLRRGINCIRDYPQARREDFEHILRNPHYTEFLIGDAMRAEDIPNAHARAGYLDEIDKFDAAFFGIPPAEATFMDPYQRVALEIAHEAMEDAGYGGNRLHGSRTGVYIGKEGTNYSLYRYCSVKDGMQLTGSWESIMASRISYLFNLRGPCMVVDTACSAGLVSIHMAAQAVLGGECDVAIAGGINLSVTGEFNTRFQGGMNMDAVESEDGIIRTFDARADGTVWGEGAALVVLKPLSRALADGDPIHAVIKGSAINNDGASNGLTAPNAEAQEEVILAAWENAGIHPESLSYVEAHGTGTVLGDPIEFKGLTSAFRRHTAKRQFCAIGSLKTNMGHLVAASGVASLFKVVKSLEHSEMAPTINFGQPNPYINFLASPLFVNDAVRPWQRGAQPRRAALSSFGFSHTNCHMVVEEAPQRAVLPLKQPAYCLTLSGQTREVLLDYVERLRNFCRGSEWNLADLCFTANTGRGHHAHRLAVVASSEQSLREQIERCADVIGGQVASDTAMYRHHAIVSERKKQREAHEITDKEKKNLSELAASRLERGTRGDGGGTTALVELARHYVQGASVDWDAFYAGEPRRRLSMPTYPFQRIRLWADPKITRIASFDTRLHPLVDRLVSRTETEVLFESEFSADTHWVLSDHKIMNACVVPGTTYLEMARVAAALAFGWETLELRDVFFLVPMLVEPGQQRRVRIALRLVDGTLQFDIESSAAKGEPAWLRHVEGRMLPLAGEPGPALDIAALKARATESVEDYQGESDTGVFQFGPHWDVVRSAWRIGDDALARLVLPDALKSEVDVFRIHPSVLDNAVNLTSQSTGATFLPFTYKSYRVFRPFTATMFSLIVPKAHKAGAETLSYDVTLTDENGAVLGEIRDYVAKKVKSFDFGATDSGADGEYLSTRWVPTTLAAASASHEGHWVIVGAGGADGLAPVLSSFAARQLPVRHVRLTMDAADLAGDPACVLCGDESLAALAAGPLLQGASGVVFAVDLALGRAGTDVMGDAAAFSAARSVGVDGLFLLAQALLHAKVKLPAGLSVLTRGAFRTGSDEQAPPCVNPLSAASAALASVIGMEYEHLAGRIVDVETDADLHDIASVLMSAAPGKLTALRGGIAHVQELYSHRLDATDPLVVREDGAYVITGGLGGLGLAAASFLASRARAQVVLLGRSELPARDEWERFAAQSEHPALAKRCAQLLDLESRLGALKYMRADVADEHELATAMSDVRAQFGCVRGVFHLAGVAGDGFLMRKDFPRFDAVLRPKLEGSRNLFALTAQEPLDFFVLFSSITALTGGQGQGDYAAANAFLDAMAEHAATQGRKLVSINWPSWKGVGMAEDFGIRDEDTPFVPLSAQDAFARLERILGHGLRRILPSAPNPAVLAQIKDVLPFTLASDLQRRLPGSASPESVGPGDDVQVHVRGKSDEELTETERALCKVYAAVLGLREIEVYTNFQDMGGNSIIATHLLKLIDEQFPDMVDISDVFSYPSIDEMATYIDGKRGVLSANAAQVKAADDTAQWEDAIDRMLEGDQSIDALVDRL